MKLISFGDWCRVVESKENPPEPVPQQLKDLCISPDSVTRQLAAYQLPNYDPADSFFTILGEFLTDCHEDKLKNLGSEILKWNSGEDVDIQDTLLAALDAFTIYEGVLYVFSDDEFIQPDLIKSNVKDGKFKYKFPVEFIGDFNCCNSGLKSFAGVPEIVRGDFLCAENPITSLVGGPKVVTGHYDCSYTQVTNLNGAPAETVGGFSCAHCELTTLVGGPKKVLDGFWCNGNKLVNLDGAPEVGASFFDCNSNKLKTLKGIQKELPSDFFVYGNQLTDLSDGPVKVGGDYHCHHNPGKFTPEYVRSVCDVAGTIH